MKSAKLHPSIVIALIVTLLSSLLSACGGVDSTKSDPKIFKDCTTQQVDLLDFVACQIRK